MIQTSFFPQPEKDKPMQIIQKIDTSILQPRKVEEVIPEANILPDTYVLYPRGGYHPFYGVPNTFPRYQLPIWPFVKNIKSPGQLNCDLGKSYGYPRLNFSLGKDENGVWKSYDTYMHKIVALAWVPNPDNKPYVMHINDDRTNYLIENLIWGTPSENNKGSFKRPDTMEQKYQNLVVQGIIKG